MKRHVLQNNIELLPLPSGKKQNRKKKLTIDEFFKLVFKEKIIKFDKNFAELRFYNVVVLFIHSLSIAVGNWILHLVQSNHTRECFNQFHIVYRQKLSGIIGNSSDMLT